jgi:hypothetical protein
MSLVERTDIDDWLVPDEAPARPGPRASAADASADDWTVPSDLPVPDRTVFDRPEQRVDTFAPRDAQGREITPRGAGEIMGGEIRRVGRNVSDFLSGNLVTQEPQPEREPGAPELPVPDPSVFGLQPRGKRRPPAGAPNALARGFVSGLVEQNPDMAAETLEGFSHLAPDDFRETLLSASTQMRGVSKLRPEEYQRYAGSLWDIENLDEALTWAGETVGQGVASTVPSVVMAAGGAAVGSRVAGKVGGIGGAIGGAAAGSFALNYGEVYKALKDEKVEPARAAELALWGGSAMAVLDSWNPAAIVAKVGGLTEVKNEIARHVARRVLAEAGKGAGREGLTEAAQEAVKEGIVAYETGKFDVIDTTKKVIESGVGGALTGGAMSGVAGVRSDARPQPQPQPHSTYTDPSVLQGELPDAEIPAGAVPADTIMPGPPAPPSGPLTRALERVAATVPPEPTGGPAAPAQPVGQLPEPQGDIGEPPAVPRSPSQVQRDLGVGAVEAGNIAEAEGWKGFAAGTREAPVRVETAADVTAGAERTAEPTPAQAEAGNYRKRHIKWQGLDIAIETEAGQERRGAAPDGTPWSVTMPAPYGYIKRTEGKDGDQVDVYIGPAPESAQVYVVDQIDPGTLRFDEHKALLGFTSEAEARATYERAFSDGSGGSRLGAITPMSANEFRAWLKGDTRKAIAYAPPAKPRKRAERGPLSLTEFIAQRGGIDPKDPLIGDVRSILGLPNRFVPGFGMLVRPGGQRLDRLREAAVEAGYLTDPGDLTGREARTTIADLLELMDADNRGQKVYSEADRGTVADREKINQEKALASNLKELQKEAKDAGLIATDAQIEQAARSAVISGRDAYDELVDMLERDAIALIDEAEQIAQGEETTDGRKADTTEASAPGAASAGAREPTEDAGAEAVEAKASRGQLDGDQRDRGQAGSADAEADAAAEPGARPGRPEHAAEVTTERTPAGEQAVIPGAERIGQGEQAQRGADAPLKPKAPQKAADEGIFGDGDKQRDLVDEARKPPPEPVDLKVNEPTEAPETGPSSLADAFAQHLESGEGFPNILQARRFAQNHDGTSDAKTVEEKLELGVVKAARRIAAGKGTPDEKFKALVDLYGRQPKLGTRTSTSMRDQAFSTPVPLAYLASRLVGITSKTTVLEPTAGNGALLIEANPAIAAANELNDNRADNLRTLGFNPTQKDATAGKLRHAGYPVDVVITNPPFGVLKDDRGQSKGYNLTEIQTGYRTNEIDHVIAHRALVSMKDDGRAVLILGGLNKLAKTEGQRSDGYNGKAKREFYKTLYDRYNVVDHFTVAGELYERQGAGWPVDVIVIDGKGKSARKLPAVDVPRIYSSWDQLAELLHGERGAAVRPRTQNGAIAQERAGSRAQGADAGVPADAPREGVRRRRSADDQSASVRSEPIPGDDGDVRRDSSRGGSPVQPAERGDAQRARDQPNAVDEFDAAFDAALDDVFGKEAPAPKGPDAIVANLRSDFDKAFAALDADKTVPNAALFQIARDFSNSVTRYKNRPQALDEIKRAHIRQRRFENKIADPRPTARVAKDAGKAAVDSADAAMAGLVQMFGGSKVSSGLSFDPETYAKAKPLFQQAATKFAEFASDVTELVKRMVGEMQRVYGLTREGLEAMRPYLRRFMEELRAEKKAPPAPAKPGKKEQATATQLEYTPKSGVAGLGTLVPVNMKSSIENALARLEERVGPLESFVAKELGYSAEEVAAYFGAEQVDALALAIDNMKRGKGFIIGDQTGIGKGRVNAGIIRWAIKNKYVPVFVTEKPNLYGDMYRDLGDIGFDVDPKRLLMTNTSEAIPLDEAGAIILRSQEAKKHNAHLLGLTPATFKSQYDVVFTTYNQMQTVAENETARRSFLRNMAPNAVLIFDESHNAGGQKARSRGKEEGAEVGGRAGLARELILSSGRVFYSSATYAKRPDVMDLYSATDMSMAVADPSELGEAIAQGGVPMQQAVAAMLAEAGQYVRRERSFAGVTYDTPIVDVDTAQYDGISRALADIQAFSLYVEGATKRISQDLKEEAGAASTDGSTGGAGANSLNFTSVLHNLINQMLLAMKAQKAAERAIEAIKAGEKPVLTVANTMESFLNDYVKDIGVQQGEVVEADFGRVLHRYLERTRTITLKRPFMKKGEKGTKLYLPDETLGLVGLAAYDKAKAAIEKLDLTNLPISPIDALKGRIEKAGYKVGEITGRQTIVDYTGKQARLRSRSIREISIRGRRETIGGFNSGTLDAIVINQAGATGLSLHASEKFKDKRKRRMIIVQPEANIDTHMQMLGRVHRTGQVVVPSYDQLIAGIPAEKRPAAVLAKKMASLNANTTASRGGALTAKDVPDFINEYGDRVAHQYMVDRPELNVRLGKPLHESDSGALDHVDAMRKVTGRIPLLPLKEQEEMYAELEAEYADLLAQMDAAGENALEAKTLDFGANTLETTTVVPAKDSSSSPFAAPVVVEKVSVKRLGKPYTWDEVQAKVAAAVDKFANAGGVNDVRTRFAEYKRSLLDDIEDPKLAETGRVKLDAIKDRWDALRQIIGVAGARVTLKTNSGNLSGVVLDVSRQGKPKNPLALSSWKVTIAIPDASRQITIPFSRLWETGKSDPDSDIAIEIDKTPDWIESEAQTRERFDHGQSDVREERYIATGNILGAYDYLSRKGQIVHFTDEAGNVRQGVLTKRGFDLGKHASTKAVAIGGPADIKAWLDKRPGTTLVDAGDDISLINERGDYLIKAHRAKRRGGKYFLDKKLTDLVGDFRSVGGFMVAGTRSPLPAIERLQALGVKFVAPREGELDTQKIEAASRRPVSVDGPRIISGQLKGARIAAPDALFEWLQIPRGEFFANFTFLQRKHPNVFRTGEDARQHVLDVLTNAHTGIHQKRGSIALIATMDGDRLVAFDVEQRQGRYTILTAYPLEEGTYDRIVSAAERDGALTVHRSIASPAGETQSRGVPRAVPGQDTPTAPESQRDDDPDSVADTGATLTRAAQNKRRELEAELTGLARYLAGSDVRIRFEDRIPMPRTTAWGELGEKETAAGTYVPAEMLIRVAMADDGLPLDPASTVIHEAFHYIEDRLLRPNERQILAQETLRLRAFIEQRTRLSMLQGWTNDLAPMEVRAVAFELYAQVRGGRSEVGINLHTGVRRIFERLIRFFEALRNKLRGMGFQTAEDIFSTAYEGAYSGRRPHAYSALTPQIRAAMAAASRGPVSVDPLTATAAERQQAMQGFIARGQPLDRALRVPFAIFGGTTPDGQWKPGLALYDKAAQAITSATFSPEGRFSFLNPLMETARRGLVDRYGLDQDYVARERGRANDERAVLLQAQGILGSLKNAHVGAAEAKVLQAILTGEAVGDGEMGRLAEPIRAAIDQLGQQAVALGLVSPESFERNRAIYLHRVYKKYEADANGLNRMVNAIMGGLRKKIVGNQFKGRGLFEDRFTVDELMRDVLSFHGGARGRPEKGERFMRLDEMPQQGALQLDEQQARERPLRTVWWPADEAIPDRYAGFRNSGVWEVRGYKAGRPVLWRDFTKAERVKMGEIVDARYTIAKTFMLMAHDLSVGKFYKDIAENEDWASTAPPDGNTVDAAEWARQRRRFRSAGGIEWVRVPETEIPDSGGKKRWGAIAGKFVREEIWRDLNELDVMQNPHTWRALLTQWKLNKTARSPVVHMNNVMSNFLFMDLIDVRAQDLVAGIRSYLAGDRHYQEALEHGAFGADMMSQEIRDTVLRPVLQEIMRDNTFAQGGGRLGALGQVSRFTELLWSKLIALDQRMIDLYRAEDEIFRMAAYLRRRQLGDDARQAAIVAREQFLDYDIRAPWVNAARNTVLPFIAYTYRAVPLIAKAVATRPWKLAKYFTLAYLANALAYAVTGDDEDKERRSLREREQGRTWIGVPRMLRMPVNDRHGNPIFLDINRWIPAGDVFDLQGDMPAWLQLGGPLMIGAELFLNRQAFTGQEIVNTRTDDFWDRSGKRADHLYKAWMPSAAWVPGSWYWEAISNAIQGATDRQGRPYSVGTAAASSVGIKLKPHDVADAFAMKAIEFRRIERELQAEARRLATRRERNMISEAAFNRAMSAITRKFERLGQQRDETFRD